MHSSIQIILERAMSGTANLERIFKQSSYLHTIAAHLSKLIAACGQDQSIETRSKALPSLQLLTRKGMSIQ